MNNKKRTLAADLSGAQKVAALLLAMGKESAERITEHFSPEELKALVKATQSLPGMNADTVDELIREFGFNYEQSGLAAASPDLVRIMGEQQNREADGENDSDTKGDEKPAEISQTAVKNFFETEPPLMSAILMGALGDDVVGAVFAEMDEALRNEILNIYLTRETLGEEHEAALKAELLSIIAGGGDDEEETSKEEQKTAGLMAYFDDDVVENILKSVEDNDPEIAARIRKSIFRFSQIPLLSEEAVAILVDKLETDDITAALFQTESNITEALLKPLSQRNRRIVENDLERGNGDEKKADTARKKIAAIAITLAKEGQIALP